MTGRQKVPLRLGRELVVIPGSLSVSAFGLR